MTRLRVVHESTYHYEDNVSASHNEARMLPVPSPRQFILESQLKIDPVTWAVSYVDYWGTRTTAFDVLIPHRELTLIASSLVETYPFIPEHEPFTWTELKHPDVQNDHVEFLLSPNKPGKWQAPSGVEDQAKQLLGASPYSTLEQLAAWVATEFTVDPTAHASIVPLEVVYENRSGSRQDIVHVALALLRSLGIPARYVAGYCSGSPESGVETGPGYIHAWLEAWLGYWHPFDIFSGTSTDDRYITIGHGRDYTDVPPFIGAYTGSERSRVDVTVQILPEPFGVF